MRFLTDVLLWVFVPGLAMRRLPGAHPMPRRVILVDTWSRLALLGVLAWSVVTSRFEVAVVVAIALLALAGIRYLSTTWMLGRQRAMEQWWQDQRKDGTP